MVNPRLVTVRLDRVIICSGACATASPPRIKGYEVLRDLCIRPGMKDRTYDRVRMMRCPKSGIEVYWQYRRRMAWLKPWRIEVVGDDQEGISRRQLGRLLIRCPSPKFVLAELAVDFGLKTGVSRDFVKEHGVFGKSRRVTNRGGPQELRYGTRRSGKLVRCYWKQKVSAYRVELELHSALLRALDVNRVWDLAEIAGVMFPKHIRFVRLNWSLIRKALWRHHRRQAPEIVAEAKRREQISLGYATRYLRRQGLVNLHRFFSDMPANRMVRKALSKWSRRFKEDERF